MVNRLANATSPYLLQHAQNPVDWWQWGPEAFAEATRRDVPILLSVGYAACHWCHVMAHESFEDAQVAQVVNELVVAIKVDREERPDIDAVYMTATQALTGHGGWPMTCLLTPTGEPFWAGTYLPTDSFVQLITAGARAWAQQREQVMESAASITAALQSPGPAPSPTGSTGIDTTTTAAAVSTLARSLDHTHGGFGHAPKFPPSMVLEFLLRHHARTADEQAKTMATMTMAAMVRSGLYDQLGGGFARYAVDAAWVVPHFEKMLYDNAQLLRVLAHLARADDDPLWVRAATETIEFLLRDLRTEDGAFASALDADTIIDGRHVEGATYVWTPDQLVEVLGQDDGQRAADLLSVTEHGTFEHGMSTLQLRGGLDTDSSQWWQRARLRLLAARDARPQPLRDDKVVTAWNGLAIAALADAGVILERPDVVAAAQRAAALILDTHLVEGRLRRTSRGGVVSEAPGMADDHGNLAEGLLALFAADGNPRWLAAAGDLLDDAAALFLEDGLVHDTPADGEALITRPRSDTDGAEPCGRSALAGAWLTHAALTGRTDQRQRAEQALSVAASLAATQPRFAGWTLAVAEAALAGPLQVAVVTGPNGDEGQDGDGRELLRVARRSPSPGLVIAHGAPDTPGVPLLAQRSRREGRATAYLCRGFVCQSPTTDPAELAEQLHVDLAPR